MGQFTSTNIERYDINTNGLGEIVRIPLETQVFETGGDDSSYVSTTERYQIALKPYPGVKIDGATMWYTRIYSEPGYESTENVHDDEPSKFNLGVMYYHPDEQSYYDYTWAHDGAYVIGLVDIDIESDRVEVSTNNRDEVSWNKTEFIRHIEITGERDYLTLNVVGQSQCQQSLYYTLYGRAYVIRTHNGTEHTYSNIIGFEQPYMESEYDSEFTMHQCYLSAGSNKVVVWVDVLHDQYDNLENKLANRSVTSSSGLYVYDNRNNASDHPIREILVYVDTFLEIYAPGYEGKSSNYDKEPTCRCLTTQSDPSWYWFTWWDGLDDASIVLSNPGCGGIYFSQADYEKNKDVDTEGLPETDRLKYLASSEETQISKVDRWVRKFNISGFYYIVRQYVPNQRIQVNCQSTYSRFTDYWYVSETSGVSTSRKDSWIVKTENGIPKGKGCNKTCYPMMKPFAAVELVVFDHGEKGNFGHDGDPNTNGLYNTVHGRLLRNYNQKYCKTINIRADGEVNAQRRTMEDYVQVQSPFRIEHFVCHGTRKEYDEGSSELVGKSGIALGQFEDENGEKRYTRVWHSGFHKIHQLCREYNEYSPINWCVFDQCCFGQGIVNDRSRSSGSHICNEAYNVVNDNNAMVMFCACGTHSAYGEDETYKDYSQYPFDRALQLHSTYAGITQEYNNLVQKCREATFKLIKEFYVNNYDLMRSLLTSSNYQTMWDDTRQYILNDINRNGDTYFCRQDHNNPEYINYDASDNFIEYSRFGKQYRIFDGFIGYIEKAINPDLVAAAPHGYRDSWPRKDGRLRLIAEKCRDYFNEQGFNMWYFLSDEDAGPGVWHEKYDVNANATIPVDALQIGDISDFNVDKLDEELTDKQEADLIDIIEEGKKAWNTLIRKQKILANSVTKLYVEACGNTYHLYSENIGDVSSATAFLLPICRVSGAFAEEGKEFMRNPNVIQDNWLKDDHDLQYFSQLNSLNDLDQ